MHIIFGRLDRYVAVAGVAVGIVLYFVLGGVAPDYIGVGIALSVACVLYLVLSRHGEKPWEMALPGLASFSPFLLLNALFFILLSSILLMLYFSGYERPPGYFIAVAFICAVVALEIVTTPKEAKGRIAFILLKILVIAFILRSSVAYIFPGSYLGTDPWRNAVLYEEILLTGHLVGDMGSYYNMPFQYLLVVVTSLLTGVLPREAMILSLGLFEAISISFIFLLARNVFDAKIGLMSALVLGINNLHITWGWYIVAQTLGISIAALLLYLIMSRREYQTARFRLTTFIALVALILTHSVSSFIILIILTAYYLGNVIYSSFTGSKLRYDYRGMVFFYAVALIGYWLYFTGSFSYFMRMLVGQTPALSVDIAYSPTLITGVKSMSEGVNRLGNLLFYGLASLGILSVLNQRNINLSRFSIVFSAALLTGIVFMLFFIINREVLIARWFIFLDILLAVPAAIGLFVISNAVKSGWKKLATMVVIFLMISLLMVTNTTSSFDSFMYPSYLRNRNALTESELRAADTIAALYPGIIVMDNMHALALSGSPGVREKHLSKEDIESGFADLAGLLVLRRYLVGSKIGVSTGGQPFWTLFTYDPYEVLERNKFNHVYEAETVGAYVRTQ